jgi:hypothetical protein
VVLVYKDGSELEVNLTIDSVTAFKTYVVSAKEKPTAVLIDPNRLVLMELRYQMTLKEYENIVFNEDHFPSRMDALDSLVSHRTEIPNWNDLCKGLMQEDEYRLRAKGVEFVAAEDFFAKQWLIECTNDESYVVRKAAVSRLTDKDMLLQIFSNDNSLEVASLALTKLAEVDSVKGLEIANWVWDIIKQERVPHERYGTATLATIFAKTGDIKYIPYFKSVCESGCTYPLMELEGTAKKPGPMIRWMEKLSYEQRKDFIAYLNKFNKFQITIGYFGPKVLSVSGK